MLCVRSVEHATEITKNKTLSGFYNVPSYNFNAYNFLYILFNKHHINNFR